MIFYCNFIYFICVYSKNVLTLHWNLIKTIFAEVDNGFATAPKYNTDPYELINQFIIMKLKSILLVALVVMFAACSKDEKKDAAATQTTTQAPAQDAECEEAPELELIEETEGEEASLDDLVAQYLDACKSGDFETVMQLSEILEPAPLTQEQLDKCEVATIEFIENNPEYFQ